MGSNHYRTMQREGTRRTASWFVMVMDRTMTIVVLVMDGTMTIVVLVRVLSS